jgi:CRP-like cAMP-binding protein
MHIPGSLTPWAESSLADDDVPILYNPFNKLVDSDLADEEVLNKLILSRDNHSLLTGFSDDELRQLIPVLTVMRFSDGDKVISKGERATFAAFVLEGGFLVEVNEQLCFDCVAGDTLGEMAYFEGGLRSAHVYADGPAVLAIVLFEHLEALKHYEPELYGKLTSFLALASISKLRNTVSSLESFREAAVSRLSQVSTTVRAVASGDTQLAIDNGEIVTVSSGTRTRLELSEVKPPSAFRSASIEKAARLRRQEREQAEQLKIAQQEAEAQAKAQATSPTNASASSPTASASASASASTATETASGADAGAKAESASDQAETLFRKHLERRGQQGSGDNATNPRTAVTSRPTAHAGALAASLNESVRGVIEMYQHASVPNLTAARKVISAQQNKLKEVRTWLKEISRADGELRKTMSKLRDTQRQERIQFDALSEEKLHFEERMNKCQRDAEATVAKVSLQLDAANETVESRYAELKTASERVFRRMYMKLLRYSGEAHMARQELAQMSSHLEATESERISLLHEANTLTREHTEANDRAALYQLRANALRGRLSSMLAMYAENKLQRVQLHRLLLSSTTSAMIKLSRTRKVVYNICEKLLAAADETWFALSPHIRAEHVYLGGGDTWVLRDDADMDTLRTETAKKLRTLQGQTVAAHLHMLQEACTRLNALRTTHLSVMSDTAASTKARVDAALQSHARLASTLKENETLTGRVCALEAADAERLELERVTAAEREATAAMVKTELHSLQRTRARLANEVKDLSTQRDTVKTAVEDYAHQARAFAVQCEWTLEQHRLHTLRTELQHKAHIAHLRGDMQHQSRLEEELQRLPVQEVPPPLSLPAAPSVLLNRCSTASSQSRPVTSSASPAHTPTYGPAATPLPLPGLRFGASFTHKSLSSSMTASSPSRTQITRAATAHASRGPRRDAHAGVNTSSGLNTRPLTSSARGSTHNTLSRGKSAPPRKPSPARTTQPHVPSQGSECSPDASSGDLHAGEADMRPPTTRPSLRIPSLARPVTSAASPSPYSRSRPTNPPVSPYFSGVSSPGRASSRMSRRETSAHGDRGTTGVKYAF